MRNQPIFLIACFILLSSSLIAQRVNIDQSFGLSGSGSTIHGVAMRQTDTTNTLANFELKLLQFGIVYYPRVDFIRWKGGSFSIGTPLMAGFSVTGKYRSTDLESVTGKRDTVTGVSGVDFAFSVPVVVDLNIGLHSADEESTQRLGIYVGGGYGYNYTRVNTSQGKVNYDGFESVFRAGIRLGRVWENRFTIGFNVRGLFENAKAKTYEVHFVKDL